VVRCNAARAHGRPGRLDGGHGAEDIKVWLVRLLDTYSDSYANNQFRRPEAVL
jgi:hypothetical protein